MTRSPQIDQLRGQARRLLAEQRALVGTLLKLREQIGGTLVERYVECRKVGCACREGQRHGPYFILSTRSAGRGGYAYLKRPQVAHARQLVQRHQGFQKGLRQLRRVNQELVTVLRRYREATTRLGERRLRETAVETKA